MSASEEWNKRVAAMKEAREKKRAGSPSPSAPTGGSRVANVNTPQRGSPSRRGPQIAGSRRGPRGSFRRGSPAARGGTAGPPENANAARELNLAKAELKILQMKYDSEVKKRESLEKQLQIARESNANTSTRPTKRTSTKMARQSVAPQVNTVSIINKVLAEMQRLEDNIKRADSQRNQAETELLEVAMLKQTADEALDSLIQDIGKRVVHLSEITSSLRTVASSVPQAQAQIEKTCDSLDSIRQGMISRMDKKAINVEKDKSFKRASVFVQKLDLSTPPPPAPTIGPPVISPPSLGPTRAGRGVRAAGPRESTLLTQIRKGQALNKIDPEALARERAQNRSNCRQSMALLSSLKDTLRMALNVRQDDMNLYGGDDDDGWDD